MGKDSVLPCDTLFITGIKTLLLAAISSATAAAAFADYHDKA